MTFLKGTYWSKVFKPKEQHNMHSEKQAGASDVYEEQIDMPAQTKHQ